jgi:hypothetical protein
LDASFVAIQYLTCSVRAAKPMNLATDRDGAGLLFQSSIEIQRNIALRDDF